MKVKYAEAIDIDVLEREVNRELNSLMKHTIINVTYNVNMEGSKTLYTAQILYKP